MHTDHLRELRIPSSLFDAAVAWCRDDPKQAVILTTDQHTLTHERTEFVVRSLVRAGPGEPADLQAGHGFVLQWAADPALTAARVLPQLLQGTQAGYVILPAPGSSCEARGFVRDGRLGVQWLTHLVVVGAPPVRRIALAAAQGAAIDVAAHSGTGPVWQLLRDLRIAVVGAEQGTHLARELVHLGAANLGLVDDGALSSALSLFGPDLVICCDDGACRRAEAAAWCADRLRVLVDVVADDWALTDAGGAGSVQVFIPGAPDACAAEPADVRHPDLFDEVVEQAATARRDRLDPHRAGLRLASHRRVARAAAMTVIDLVSGPPDVRQCLLHGPANGAGLLHDQNGI